MTAVTFHPELRAEDALGALRKVLGLWEGARGCCHVLFKSVLRDRESAAFMTSGEKEMWTWLSGQMLL